MSAVPHAVRLGFERGWIEFRRSLTTVADMGWNVFFAIAILIVLYLQRDRTVAGTSLSLALATLPGVLGLILAQGGFSGAAGSLTLEREDGTLVRAKAVPHGMVGYLVGRIVSLSLSVGVAVVLTLVPALFLVPDLAGIDATGWFTLSWVYVLGLLATLPWGALVGSLAKGANALFGLVMLPMTAITAISGIFYPITGLPGWVQALGQVFPVYWLGLGMRAAFLPDAAAAVELTGSWRTPETVIVLGLWAVVGLVLAVPILRRVARGESGGAMQERRERAIARYAG